MRTRHEIEKELKNAAQGQNRDTSVRDAMLVEILLDIRDLTQACAKHLGIIEEQGPLIGM